MSDTVPRIGLLIEALRFRNIPEETIQQIVAEGRSQTSRIRAMSQRNLREALESRNIPDATAIIAEACGKATTSPGGWGADGTDTAEV